MKLLVSILSLVVVGVLVVMTLSVSEERKADESVLENISPEISGVTKVDTQPAVETDESEVATSTCVMMEDFDGASNMRWYVVNDGVMGGLSNASVSISDGTLTHSGELVTRGGGFSYVGTRLLNGALVGYSSLRVRLNTSGRTYAANFADARTWRVTHQVLIPETANNAWQEVTISFDDTVPTIFSRQVDSEGFDAREVEELAFILSDGIDGPFQTRIDWIKLCR